MITLKTINYKSKQIEIDDSTYEFIKRVRFFLGKKFFIKLDENEINDFMRKLTEVAYSKNILCFYVDSSLKDRSMIQFKDNEYEYEMIFRIKKEKDSYDIVRYKFFNIDNDEFFSFELSEEQITDKMISELIDSSCEIYSLKTGNEI